MNLPEKVAQLKTSGLTAVRLAMLWEKHIVLHGEETATAFYKSLGLNHLETKSVQWEGLTLSRQPTEAEKLCVKGIAGAQEAGKASVTVILLDLRANLITEAMKAIKKLTPADYHTLILEAPQKSRDKLRDELVAIFKKGRRLVAAELRGTKEADPIDFDDEIFDELTDLTDSRVVNDVQSRITAAAQRYYLLGLRGAALNAAIAQEMADGSVSYIDRASQGVANRMLNYGRSREAEDRSDEWGRVEYSALLDQNVCGPCAEDDGQEATSEDDLTPTPNPECEGGDWCRCFHVFIAEGNM